MIGSGFRVPARPGATIYGDAVTVMFYGRCFASPTLDMPGLGQGFRGCKTMIFENLYAVVWIGCFHPLDETRA
jgi:hypothetical protein